MAEGTNATLAADVSLVFYTQVLSALRDYLVSSFQYTPLIDQELNPFLIQSSEQYQRREKEGLVGLSDAIFSGADMLCYLTH